MTFNDPGTGKANHSYALQLLWNCDFNANLRHIFNSAGLRRVPLMGEMGERACYGVCLQSKKLMLSFSSTFWGKPKT